MVMSSSSAVRSQCRPHLSELLSKLIATVSVDTRLWLQGEMVRLVHQLIDSLFLRLLISPSARPGAKPFKQSQTNVRSTLSELCQLIEQEKETTNRLARGQMDGVVNLLFERLINKTLVNSEMSAFASVQPLQANHHQTVPPNASINAHSSTGTNNSNKHSSRDQITCPPMISSFRANGLKANTNKHMSDYPECEDCLKGICGLDSENVDDAHNAETGVDTMQIGLGEDENEQDQQNASSESELMFVPNGIDNFNQFADNATDLSLINESEHQICSVRRKLTKNATNNNHKNDKSAHPIIEHNYNHQSITSNSRLLRSSVRKPIAENYYVGVEGKNLNNPNCEDCADGDCNLDHENNNNHLNNDIINVTSGDVDETDIEANLDEAQFEIDDNNQNDGGTDINEKCVCERNMEQSTPSTNEVRSSTRKQIQTKVFGDLVQSNGNHGKCGKRKSGPSNESVKKAKHKQILNDDEDSDSDDKEDHATSATKPIQANLAQPNRNFHCPHCHKSFNRNSKLQSHLRVHSGERPFHCDQCNISFKERNKLTRHQLIHQNIKRFQCDQCDKQFSQKVTLETHLRIHSGERPHHCRFCDKSFVELCSRNRHEQAIHLHVKPYRCKQCAHTSAHRAALIDHIRVVHFGLPQTIKQQRALNIIDDRDPRELLEKV